MATRDSQRAELERRLGDTANAIWDDTELDGYLNHAYKSLYPTFYDLKAGTTEPGAGPIQTGPEGVKNIYRIQLRRNEESTRLRDIRRWTEDEGGAVIPRYGMDEETGAELVWSWTAGYDAPASGSDTLTIPVHAEEFAIVRAQISAIEKLLTDKVSAERYFAVQVREGVTEEDIANTLDALHVTLREIVERQPTLPEVVR